jgi:hypothetical protein
MRIHHLSTQALQAIQLTPSATPPKVRAGWVWHRLVPSYCNAGGAASYSRALVSPQGEIAYVSDRAEGPALQEIEHELQLDHSMIRLAVPFADKDEAKRLGAKWIGHHKTWACAPDQLELFSRWVNGAPETFDILSDAHQTEPLPRPRYA